MWIDALGNMQDEFPTGSTALYLVGLCSVLLLVNLSWKKHPKTQNEKVIGPGHGSLEVRRVGPGARATLKLLTPLSRTKTKDLFIHLRFNYFKVFTVGAESFFRPFAQRLEERKKLNFWKLNIALNHIMINFPSSQNSHSLCVFSQFWEQARITGK